MKKSRPKSLSLANGLRSALLAGDVARRDELGRLTRADRATRGRNDPLPTIALDHRDPVTLKEPARNVRSVKKSHVREVANAIAELGFTAPIVTTPDGTIIDGVIRARAATLLGLSTIPCVVVDPRSQQEMRLLRLASNRLGEKGAWNVDELKVELGELILDQAPLELTGFADFEIDGLTAEKPPVVEEGPLEPDDSVAITQVGDVFLLGSHRVVCGSALDPAVIAGVMRGWQARFVFTDEPYNVKIRGNVTQGAHREFAMASGEMEEDEFLSFNDGWIAAAAAHLVDGGVLATFIDWRGLPSVTAAALEFGLSQLNLVVWSKTNAGMGALYRAQHELLPLFKKGATAPLNNVEMGKKSRWRSNVWTYPGASSRGSDARRGLKEHPTVKPVAMLSDALLDLTNRGDVVLDPFLGSGSTLIACERTSRICYGVELDPPYVDLIARRFRTVTGRSALLEATGETFEDLTIRRSAEAANVPVTIALPPPRAGRLRPARTSAPTQHDAA